MYDCNNKPIGIMPKDIHDKIRAHELASAIERYVFAGEYSNADRTIVTWCQELEELARDLQEHITRELSAK